VLHDRNYDDEGTESDDYAQTLALGTMMPRRAVSLILLIHLMRAFRDGDQVLLGLLDFLLRSLGHNNSISEVGRHLFQS
jgi:hypothetical protein